MYACDDHWFDAKISDVREQFKGEIWTQSLRASKKYKINVREGVSAQGLGREKIHFGNNSGYQAINLAYLFGASRIVLLGFDMKTDAGKVHFFGNHSYHRQGQGPNNQVFARWKDNFVHLARDLEYEGVEVINATRDTTLDMFTRVRNVDDILWV